jgi:penicillin-binding protein 1A
MLMGSLLTVCALGLGVMGIVGWVVAVADSAPNIEQLKPRLPGQVSQVFAADGSLLGYISSSVLRTVVSPHQLPNRLREATVAIEDRRFYQHGGVDYQGILRAGLKDLFDGGSVQGGSTLTMQLVNNVYLPNRIKEHHNIQYKIIQAKLANELQSNHSRAWILDQYLNDVDYGTVGGQSAIGVGAAAHMFFDKRVSRLNLAQIALLAGLPQAPSEYNPFNAPGLARHRRMEVLYAMVRSGYITRAEADAANVSPLQVKQNNTYGQVNQPYVFDYVKRQLVKELGASVVDQGGLKIYTTINLHDQALARTAILAHEGQPGDPAAALVSIDPTNGNILAMAQSTTYGTAAGETNYDYATDSQRQTGSAFKPFVLMTMIHDYDGDPNQTYYNSHLLAPGWLPSYPTFTVHTSELTYQGNISVTHAMTISDNTVFAQLGVDLGMDKVDQTAHAMGITAPLFGYPAEAIGGLHIGVSPLQMSDAYATLANGGSHYTPTIFDRVTLPGGRTVELGNPKPKTVFTDGETYAADQVLKTVITSGTGTAAEYGCPAAGKTGTTSSYTDAWFVGYTPQLSTAVWVGYPNATTSMTDVNGLGPGFGGTLAAPIWHDYMLAASGGYCGDFPQPTTPWHGTAYFGNHATSGRAPAYNYNYTGGAGVTTPTTTSTTPGSTTTTPGTTTPGATPTTGGPGATTTPGTHTTPGNGPPSGFGTGQTPASGGAGVKKK